MTDSSRPVSPPPSAETEMSAHPWATLERLMADLEGDAVSDSNACPSCTHPSCERRRAGLKESRAALRAFVESPAHAVSPTAPAETEKMLIEHERLCMEDLWAAFRASDASRAIAPVTTRILASRKAILDATSPVAPTADFKELLDALEAAVRAKASDYGESVHRVALDEANEAALRASRKALEDYVAVITKEREDRERIAKAWEHETTIRDKQILELSTELSSLRSSQITAGEIAVLEHIVDRASYRGSMTIAQYEQARDALNRLAGAPIEGK